MPKRRPWVPLKKHTVLTATCGEAKVFLQRFPLNDQLMAWKGEYLNAPMCEDLPEEGMLILSVRLGQQQATFPMSALTEDALNCFFAAITEAVELIRPECQAADQRAKEAFDEHGVFDLRLSEAVPAIHRADGTDTFYVDGVPQ